MTGTAPGMADGPHDKAAPLRPVNLGRQRSQYE